MGVDVPGEMAAITERHAGERLRFFAVVDPDDREVDPIRLRSDLEWTADREDLVRGELMEVVAKESYEQEMNATNVNQIIKVADDKVLFTGFVGDDVVVAAFERGGLRVVAPHRLRVRRVHARARHRVRLPGDVAADRSGQRRPQSGGSAPKPSLRP
ncbi:hypothetical protein [Halobaculum sp. EA56]|uniref:hypothetical protein n=1 Tax=Halobaculum sp. EA56 TaxID=3421648 RepID=UPI003EB704E0